MKERLTGAIILVALIVLLVPELLTGPVRSAPRTAVVAASAEEPPLRSYTINLADDGHGHSAAAPSSEAEQPALPAPAGEPPAAAGSAAPAPPPPAQTPSPAPTVSAPSAPSPSAHAPANSSAAAASGGAFMVQLGSFASRSNAEHLAQRLRSRGYGVSVSQADGARHLYRVRVGPARDHDAALQLAQQLRSIGQRGSVVAK